MQTNQQNKHTKRRPNHQTELPWASERVNPPLPEKVVAECRPLIAQLLHEMLLAEKEEPDEH
jgi:hypothetical protein